MIDNQKLICYNSDKKLNMNYLHWLPEEIRNQHLTRLKGWKAIKFPAPYFPKAPKAGHLAWVNLCPLDSDGMVVKTGPDFLVDGLIKTLDKYKQPYEIEIIQ